jgi:hypothetical protein
LVFDVSNPERPTARGSVDVSGEPLWVHATAEGLWVVATGLDVERQKVVDRLLHFGLNDVERPTELARIDLEGRFVRARAVDDGVVLLTAISDERICYPEQGPESYWVPLTELALNAYSANGGEIERVAELRVEGDGYVELPEGFAITLGQNFETRSLQLVEVDPTGQFMSSARIELTESLVPTAPMQLHDGKLRLFEVSGAGFQLTEVDLEMPSQRRSVSLSTGTGYPRGPDGSAFSGALALVSVDTSSQSNEGAQVISFAGASPEVVFTFDAPVNWFFPVSFVGGDQAETWLGFAQSSDGGFELVRFDLSPDGSIAVTGTLQLPDEVLGASWGPPLWIDAAAERALVPYRVDPPAEGFLLGSVSLIDELSWQPGNATVLPDFPSTPRLEDPFYWVGHEYQRSDVLAGLVNLGSSEPPVAIATPLSKNLRSLVAHSDRIAAIEQRAAETWLVYGQGDLEHESALSHAASMVRWAGDDLLVGELNTQAECVGPTSPCEAAPPRFSVVDGKDGNVRGSFELPWVELRSSPEVNTIVEWLEVVLGPRGAGLLQRRGFACYSQAACEEHDIPYAQESDGDLQGQIDEMWLYPVDTSAAILGEPTLLDRLDAYEFITAQGFVQEDGFSLLSAKDVVHRQDFSGIETAQLSLLVSPGPETTSVPLRGWPVAVLDQGGLEAPVVITLEPGAADTGDTLHRLVLDGDETYVQASLALGDGYQEHAWADEQGYVLSQSADRCASDRFTRLRLVQSDADGLALTAEFQIVGHGWKLLAQSDERVVLEQAIDGLNRVAVVDVSGEPELLEELVLGGAWYAPREGAVVGDRVFLSTTTGGLVEVGRGD